MHVTHDFIAPQSSPPLAAETATRGVCTHAPAVMLCFSAVAGNLPPTSPLIVTHSGEWVALSMSNGLMSCISGPPEHNMVIWRIREQEEGQGSSLVQNGNSTPSIHQDQRVAIPQTHMGDGSGLCEPGSHSRPTVEKKSAAAITRSQ